MTEGRSTGEEEASGSAREPVEEIIYAGLDALQAVMDLDLAAFLHESGDGGPRLHMAAPDMASITPTEAFELFSAMRDTLEDDHEGDDTVLLGGYLAVVVTTPGPAGRAMHVVGRKAAPLEPTERSTVLRLARSVGSIVTFFEAGERAPEPAPGYEVRRVTVESVGSTARAEVQALLDGSERTAVAEADTTLRAVAYATADLVDRGIKVTEVTEGQISGERAVMVLVAGPHGRTELGAVLVGEGVDPLRAAAHATLEASGRLARS